MRVEMAETGGTTSTHRIALSLQIQAERVCCETRYYHRRAA